MSHALSQRASIGPTRQSQALKYIVLGTLIVNGLGFAVYKKVQMRKAVEVTAPPAAAAAQPSTSKPELAVRSEDDGKRDLARAHRASGLAALESGDYALAVRSFTSALKLSNKDSDTAELLKIAKDLQERAKEGARRAVLPAEPAPAAQESATELPKKADSSRTSSRPLTRAPGRSSSRRVASVTPVREEPEEPIFGTLLVTSNPSGLLVEVNGRSMDLTPAKLRLEPGSHMVALLRGSTRLHERRIELAEDTVLSVDVDVTPALRAERAARDAALVEEDLEAAPVPEAARPIASTTARPAAPSAPPARTAGVGDVHVASSGIYGDVWINGIAFGPPPVLAKNIAEGTATVEIRVGGSTRRSKTIEVAAGQRTTLKLR